MILLAAVVAVNCSKKAPPKNYIAKVNDTYLTNQQLTSLLESSGRKQYRSEVIRNWVNRQVLYQEAEKEGITNQDLFKNKLNESRIELAGALLTQKVYDKEKIKYDSVNVRNYFEEHKDEFKLFDNSYYLNMVEFGSEDKAVQFRTLVLEKGWENALEIFANDHSMIKNNYQSMFNEQDIYPVSLLRVIKELYPKEVSIVVADEMGGYTVVQLINHFAKGTIPPFDAVKSKALKRLIEKRKEDVLRSYLQSLIEKYEIEIKN